MDLRHPGPDQPGPPVRPGGGTRVHSPSRRSNRSPASSRAGAATGAPAPRRARSRAPTCTAEPGRSGGARGAGARDLGAQAGGPARVVEGGVGRRRESPADRHPGRRLHRAASHRAARVRQDGPMAATSTSPRTTDADRVLSETPFALLAGMMLDQQFPMERAFAGPAKIARALRGLRPARRSPPRTPRSSRRCAAQPPAVHRFPGSMAARMQALAQHVVDGVRRRHRPALERGGVRQGADEAARGAARLRQAEGADLRGPAGQAARRPPRRAGRRPRATTPRRVTARWPTSSTRTRWQGARFKKEKKAAAKA